MVTPDSSRKPRSNSSAARAPRRARVRPLPLRATVRLRDYGDVWYKHGLSGAVAFVLPALLLLAAGRLDLIMYTSAGTMVSLYAHGLPYAARARALLWLVLGMTASLAVALTAAAYVDSVALLVLGTALVAAVHKVACEATGIGPPNNVVLTFLAATAFFVPQRPQEIPFHLSLQLAGGALAWLVAMAPALVRPHGPERIAVARALEAAARALHAGPGADAGPSPTPRHTAAAAVNTAWQTLSLVPRRPRPRTEPAPHAGLERLLLRAEAGPADGDATVAERTAEAARFAVWAQDLRQGRPLPGVRLSGRQRAELAGVLAEREQRRRLGPGDEPAAAAPAPGPGAGAAAGTGARAGAGPGGDGGGRHPLRPAPGRSRGFRQVLRQFRPGSPLAPVGARTAVGCALAGWVSLLLGVGHPYWAVVTAAAVFQANTTLSWHRVVQRTLGNLVGLLLFTALLPVIGTGPPTMVLLVVLFQIGAEALITRNYWLGTVCVTPMALLLAMFASDTPAEVLVADRWTDTLVGVAVGLLSCVLVTNRRAASRIDAALREAEAARDRARLLLDAPAGPGPDRDGDLARSRDRLGTALIELREALDIASGEWWQPDLPEEEAERAEREGHEVLGELVRTLAAPARPAPAAVEHRARAAAGG
ncbi:FUSC family protein [Streptomyces lycii]|uniref:FUSC family protein n=1 Tax=Streptomyces lycii TaxID=2654337 RepID=A0ABQ7FH78_9ACTN|nr:FUSC family protein [Streptomyces lycii]KAF4408356.1 FUSC family protein [Streptomyces lycii]